MSERDIQELQSVTIRFAGDSGDGMQLTGSRFTDTAALIGNDVATFPDYPAEIRAPAGTLPGVSGFQIHFGAREINTPRPSGSQPRKRLPPRPGSKETGSSVRSAKHSEQCNRCGR